MVLIVYFVEIHLSSIVWFGILFGIGTGMYYSCRNFFAGMEQLIIISSNFITPFLFGFIIIGLGEKTV